MEFLGKVISVLVFVGLAWYGANHGWGFWAYVCAGLAGCMLVMPEEQVRRSRRHLEEACRHRPLDNP
jgi:hypothetical protein